MQNNSQTQQVVRIKNRKIILLVEDDSRIAEDLCKVLRNYESDVKVIKARDAGEVTDYYTNPENANIWPDALLLDLMMTYGTARSLLNADNSDIEEYETGLRLLKWLRNEEEKRNLFPAWVAIITARSPFAVETRALKLLSGQGEIYWKPFSTLILEDCLMRKLKVNSQVPSELLIKKDNELDGDHEVDA